MSERNNTPVQEEVQNGESLSELLQIRRNKLNELMESGQNPYEITRFDVDAHAKEIVDGFDNGFEGRHVSIAVRIMSWRDMGKANFIDVQDREDKQAVYGTGTATAESGWDGVVLLEIPRAYRAVQSGCRPLGICR